MSRRKHLATLSEIVPAEDFDEAAEDEVRRIENVRIEFVKNAGNQSYVEQQTENVLKHTVRTRYNTRIKPGMFFAFDGRRINIRGPIVDIEEKNRWILVPCEEEQ